MEEFSIICFAVWAVILIIYGMIFDCKESGAVGLLLVAITFLFALDYFFV